MNRLKDLRVVVVNDFGNVNGGAAQVAIQSAIALARQGVNVTLFCAVAPVSEQLLLEKNINVICLDQEEILHDSNRARAAFRGIWNTRAAHELRKVLDDCSPNNTIIHVHGISKAITTSIIEVASKLCFPLVFTLHDYFVGCPNGLFFNYPQNEICTLRGGTLLCLMSNCDARSYSHKLWRFGRALVEKTLGGLPDRVGNFVAISDFSAQILASYLPRNATIYRIDNPIDVTKGAPVNVSANNSIVCVGRLSKEKGPNILALASRDMKYPVVFVGDGYLKQELLGINPEVIVTGWLGREGVIDEMKKARILVFPSPVYETLGMAVLEAASLGVPCIISDASAARDFVRDGENGLWFSKGSVGDLHQKLQKISDGDLIERMGKDAYNRFWEKPRTLANHRDALMDMYEQMLRKAR